MKTVYNYKIQDREYHFICETYENSYSWGHKVELYSRHYNLISEAKIRYYNRTWEMYRYQSAMLKAIRELLNVIEIRAIENYKQINNISRLTAKRKAEIFENISKYLNDDKFTRYNDMKKLYDNVYHYVARTENDLY